MLQTLPSCIGQLTNLQELDLSSNQLSSLPFHINQLTCLKKLDLTNNKLQALPISLFQLYDNNNLSIKLARNPLFKADGLYPLIVPTLRSYAYSKLPLSLRSLCANAVLEYAEKSNLSCIGLSIPQDGVLQKTWRGVGKMFRCTNHPQPTRPFFTKKRLKAVLPKELWLGNLSMLIEQEYEEKNPQEIVCFKNMSSQAIPCYLPYSMLYTPQSIKIMLQQIKESNLKCYLVIN